MDTLSRPPKLDGSQPQTWVYFCARPISRGRRCRAKLEGVGWSKAEVPTDRPWKEWARGPDVVHLPCGHIWRNGAGWIR